MQYLTGIYLFFFYMEHLQLNFFISMSTLHNSVSIKFNSMICKKRHICSNYKIWLIEVKTGIVESACGDRQKTTSHKGWSQSVMTVTKADYFLIEFTKRVSGDRGNSYPYRKLLCTCDFPWRWWSKSAQNGWVFSFLCKIYIYIFEKFKFWLLWCYVSNFCNFYPMRKIRTWKFLSFFAYEREFQWNLCTLYA